MSKSKTVEIAYIENIPYKIAWVYFHQNKLSHLTYKRSYKTKNGKFDKCANITVRNNKITSFSVVNCNACDFESKIQNYDFCKRIGPGLWKIESLSKESFYVDRKFKTCFNTDLLPASSKSYQTFKSYIISAKMNLNNIKFDTYYDQIYQKKIIVHGQSNSLVNEKEVKNFLLCCNRLDFLPELIPEVLKFISYI